MTPWQETAALRHFDPAYDRCESDSVIRRCRFRVRFARKRTWNVHRHGSNVPYIAAFRRTGVTEYWIGTAASVGLDVGRPDHLAPFLGFVGDELCKIGG
jgi:hypothetical protein